jgi:hypothetical protein
MREDSALRDNCILVVCEEPGLLSRYSDWLQGGHPKGRNSSRDEVKNFYSSASSRLALDPPSPIYRGSLSGGRAAGA